MVIRYPLKEFRKIIRAKPVPSRYKYRIYSPSALTNAYKMVKDEHVSVLRTSKLHGVPETTLRDRLAGRIHPETVTMGVSPLFSQYHERKMLNHFQEMADFGYGYTAKECIDIASDYAVQLGLRSVDQPLTFKWLKGFRSRWPEMKKLKPRALELARAKQTSEEKVTQYFNNLKECLVKHDLIDKPHLLFNVDEKGVTCNHNPPSVFTAHHSRPSEITSGKGKTVTILGCGSASGYAIPPFLVFPGKRLVPDLMKGASPGTSASMSETGWSNARVFRDYLENHFLKYVPGRNNEKIFLILDGHKSHISVGLFEWASSKNIIVFVLPAHTSHLLQPLDVSCFGPFQRMYDSECHKLMRTTSTVISRYNICELVCKVYNRALKAENLQSGFSKTGIYPYNDKVIPKESMLPATLYLLDSDSQATVEGGLPISNDDIIFDSRVMELKKIKRGSNGKQRKTASAIVSGAEGTDEEVLKKLKTHENNQTRTVKSEKHVSKTCKISKTPTVKQSEPVPGPSYYHVSDSDSISCDADDNDDDSELCWVCKLYTPQEVRKCTSLIFVKWGQCDGVRNGQPCNHWTHLQFCTNVRVLRREDKFFCPHCVEE